MDIKQDKNTRQEYSKRKNYTVTKLLIYSTPIGILSLQLLYTIFLIKHCKIDVAYSVKNSHTGQSI